MTFTSYACQAINYPEEEPQTVSGKMHSAFLFPGCCACFHFKQVLTMLLVRYPRGAFVSILTPIGW